VIDLNLSNHYGRVRAEEIDGKFYLTLDDYSGLDMVEISEELYHMIEKEFSK
jgi:hypothetical protein